ncbi:MAG: TatD family hydrolase [Flavobacterium sp.]|uniref:TatD family hydrolase n=1 Tax=Flavobacterium sp. TaxID=239 RepID=UPI00260D5187|nr:TatD family hydrolase [Flavobacterium sp.]MDD5151257.1 TatD family hydrolase [Flavobacterium sp.]
MIIDVHCHLDHERFSQDLDKVIDRARKSGVKFIITSGVNSSTNRKILEIKKNFSDIVKVSFGIYPLDALKKEIEIGEANGFSRDIESFDLEKEISWIEKNKNECVAIGEAGLDFKYSSEKNEQIKIFQKIIDLAKKINKPLIVHSRKAELEALELLEKSNYKKIILHCFSGKKSLIKKGIDLGFYFSVPPVITRLEHFQMLVELVPLSQLLTETDAPYLSPIQGERNESSNIKITLKEIAKIKNLPEEKVEEEIFNNSKRLFNL